jgi:RNA polymerase sigma-70 factor (ECF subfamily)
MFDRVTSERAGTSFEDAALVERYRAGDGSALTALVEKYQDRIYNTCWRMCGNAEDAADLTQETFVKVMEAIEGFGGRSSFYTWAFRIAVNLTLTHRRTHVRRRTVSLSAAKTSDGEEAGAEQWAPSNASSAEDQISERERDECVASAVNDLDDEHRTVIILRDMQALDYREIAEILDVPSGTVKSRLHRARLALKEKLGPILDGFALE